MVGESYRVCIGIAAFVSLLWTCGVHFCGECIARSVLREILKLEVQNSLFAAEKSKGKAWAEKRELGQVRHIQSEGAHESGPSTF